MPYLVRSRFAILLIPLSLFFVTPNYVKYLCDRVRSLLKRAVKEYTISEFYQNYSDIVRNVTLGLKSEESDGERPAHYGHRFFQENGMFIHDVEVLGLDVERSIENMLLDKQYDMIQKTLELADAQREAEIAEALAIAEKKKQELRTQTLINKMELQKKEAEYKLEMQAQIARQQEAEEMAKKKAEADMQPMIDAIAAANVNRRNAEHEAAMSREAAEHLVTQNHEKAMADIEQAKQEAYAETVKTIMESVDESLVAALTANANADMLAVVTKSVAPYAMAKGETVADFTNTLLRGTTLEGVVDGLTKMKVAD